MYTQKEETETHRDQHLKMKAEIGVIHLQAKNSQQTPRKLGEAQKRLSLTVLGGNQLC